MYKHFKKLTLDTLVWDPRCASPTLTCPVFCFRHRLPYRNDSGHDHCFYLAALRQRSIMPARHESELIIFLVHISLRCNCNNRICYNLWYNVIMLIGLIFTHPWASSFLCIRDVGFYCDHYGSAIVIVFAIKMLLVVYAERKLLAASICPSLILSIIIDQ